jgi:hypothetical protein
MDSSSIFTVSNSIVFGRVSSTFNRLYYQEELSKLTLCWRSLRFQARSYEHPPSKRAASLPTPRPQSDFYTINSGEIVNTPGTSRSRRQSSPEVIFISPEESRRGKSLSPLPPAPSAPALKPQRLPSIQSKSSWRLSFASENRGAHLRRLSQDETFAPQARTVITPQPVNQWLHNHGLRSASQALTWSDDNSTRRLSASHSRTCSINHVDSGGIPLDGIHLQDMIISQQLAARLQSSSAQQQSHTVEDESSRHKCSSCSGNVTNPSRMTREFPLTNAYPVYITDNSLSSTVSDVESLQDRHTAIRMARIPSANGSALDTPGVRVANEG